ncbi:MAG TPA: hypothetical protein VH183_02265 [Burkholderiaceae bacterium]|jgi:hypothetical protein|nr:hypothetical protein [Burkholderiaceae bacterium]
MNQATTLISTAIWKVVPLIVTAAFLLAAAGAAGYVLAKQNPQWPRATKQLVHGGLVFAAAVVWVVFFIYRMRSGA